MAPQAWITPSHPLAAEPQRCYIRSREAVSRVRSHISPGPYRSFRELSLAGSVDPDIWCPPTFVGNSGIERFNGLCGFALLFLSLTLFRLILSRAENRGSAIRIRTALQSWLVHVSGRPRRNRTLHVRKRIKGRTSCHRIGKARCIERRAACSRRTGARQARTAA